MPMEFKQGNILDASENVICHQVNCKGVMGAGLAKQIRQKWPKAFTEYEALCDTYVQSNNMLGICQIIKVEENKWVANIFGQDNYGRGIRHTNYESVYQAFDTLRLANKDKKYTIAIPYGFGCGLGGGNWDIIYTMISVLLKDYDVVIYSLPTKEAF